MNAKATLTGSFAVLALIGCWIGLTCARACKHSKQEDERFIRDSVSTLEGEGGIALS